jgi:succinate-semialdehyde dehydrogenase/glutarate-semialdehyde dehydrogenase
MKLVSINPATEAVNQEIDCWPLDECMRVVDQVTAASASWQKTDLTERIQLIASIGRQLAEKRDELARLITTEMGKVISESYVELDKCIFACENYAENAADFLKDEPIKSDASRSYVAYQPLGTVLGIMPWNFPFWQVVRFAIPALLTGNTVLLKHASNIPQSALAAEQLIHTAGIPNDVFRCLMIHSSQLEALFNDERINGVALTGSEQTGRKVAMQAGQNLKKVVLELGGSDAFIVLEDADIEAAVRTAVASRFFTSGQSCINAKRIIVVESIADQFIALFTDAVNALETGDPLKPEAKVGPMARNDLRDKLQQQVDKSISLGAALIVGGHKMPGKGYYYQPTILTNVRKGMPAYDEELFGPVVSVLIAKDEQDAIRIANDTKYGLGGTVWTTDQARGENVARQLETGSVYVNGLMKSDPRLPFGGVKSSGMGRELGRHGMLEFANAKTIWVS